MPRAISHKTVIRVLHEYIFVPTPSGETNAAKKLRAMGGSVRTMFLGRTLLGTKLFGHSIPQIKGADTCFPFILLHARFASHN